MCCQTTRRCKPLLTDVTLERTLSAVRLDMNAQVLRAAERFPADEALVRLHAGVDHAVTLEVRQTRKPLVAHAALKRSAGVIT